MKSASSCFEKIRRKHFDADRTQNGRMWHHFSQDKRLLWIWMRKDYHLIFKGKRWPLWSLLGIHKFVIISRRASDWCSGIFLCRGSLIKCTLTSKAFCWVLSIRVVIERTWQLSEGNGPAGTRISQRLIRPRANQDNVCPLFSSLKEKKRKVWFQIFGKLDSPA